MANIANAYTGMFSERLKNLRIEKELRQIEVAEYLGVSLQSYSAYENGREPNYTILIKLSKYFKVSTDYLVGASEQRSQEAIKKYNQTNQAVLNFMYKNDSFRQCLFNFINLYVDFSESERYFFMDNFSDILSNYNRIIEILINSKNRISDIEKAYKDAKLDELSNSLFGQDGIQIISGLTQFHKNMINASLNHIEDVLSDGSINFEIHINEVIPGGDYAEHNQKDE